MVLKRTALRDAKYSVFKKTIDEEKPSYNALSSLRTYLNKQETSDLNNKKIRNIQNRMKEMISEGVTGGRKRVPGTGKKVVTKVTYKDTPENRKAGRVGQTYDKVTYEGAEYTDHVQKKMRKLKLKRKRVDQDGNPIEPAPKRRNFWIEAMAEAKKELQAPPMVIPRKTVEDESDPAQVMGFKVYRLAVKLNKEKKEAAKAAKEAEEAAAAKQDDGAAAGEQ